MAEEILYTPYNPSGAAKSGYACDFFWCVPGYPWEYEGKEPWMASEIRQGGRQVVIDPDTKIDGYFNHYGVVRFNFNAIREKNITHYPTKIRIRFQSITSTSRTLHVRLGKSLSGWAQSSRPVAATGTSYKTVTTPSSADAWCELTTEDQTWLNALVDTNTMCVYINRHTSGYGNGLESNWDTNLYWRGHGNNAELWITWEPRNIAPSPPSSITIEDTNFGVGDNIGGVTGVDIIVGDASDEEDEETDLLYQIEYSIGGGAWEILQSWEYNKRVTHNFSSIPSGQLIQYRAVAKDTLGGVSEYIYTSNYAYKIPAPSAPASVVTPSTITTNSKMIEWTPSALYDASVGVKYVAELYDPKSTSWIEIANNISALTYNMNAYTVLSLDEENQQYYYQTTNRIRVKAIFAQAVQGQVLESSAIQSNVFTIDYRTAPQITSFSVNYSGTAKGYEGVSYNVSVVKGSATGNKKDSNGNPMQYSYRVDLLYGTEYASVRNLAQTSNYVWESLPDSVQITIPSNIITTSDIPARIRVKIYNIEGLNTYPVDSNFIMKRYRNPVVDITSFTRNETDFSITFSITDTGLNDQDTGDITSAIASFSELTPKGYVFDTELFNLAIQFTADDGVTNLSSGIVTLVVTNNPEDSMPPKNGSDTQAIPQAIANLRIASSGVYAKNSINMWDTSKNVVSKLDDAGRIFGRDLLLNATNGIGFLKSGELEFSTTESDYNFVSVDAQNVLQYNGNKIWHSGNDGNGSTLDADLLDGQHGNYYKQDYVSTTNVVLGRISADAGAIEEIPMSGVDNVIITGTAGTSGNPAAWNSDGDLVDGLEFSGDATSGYYKYADGRLECYKVVTLTNISVNTAWGGVYNYAYTEAGDFAHPFTFVEYVGGACRSSNYSLWVANRNTPEQPSNTSWGEFFITRPASATSVNCTLYLRAIGRWK